MYADADTTCTRPIDLWMPEEDWNDPSVHSVIGIEYSDENHPGSQGWCGFSPSNRKASLISKAGRFFDFVQCLYFSYTSGKAYP
jgi:hypothetical protein